MKAILMSVHAKWCALMMNGDKKVEVRRGTALYKAIQKLIDENGYADIYDYCTKDHSLIYTDGTDAKGDYVDYKYYESYKGDKNDIGSGLSWKDKEGNACKIFEIIWQDDNFEFWFESSQLEMKLKPDRLELMTKIIYEMNRYNDEVLL